MNEVKRELKTYGIETRFPFQKYVKPIIISYFDRHVIHLRQTHMTDIFIQLWIIQIDTTIS